MGHLGQVSGRCMVEWNQFNRADEVTNRLVPGVDRDPTLPVRGKRRRMYGQGVENDSITATAR